MKKQKRTLSAPPTYQHFLIGIQNLLEEARRQAARSVNVILTATYWEIGRRIIEFEQHGAKRADYGAALLERLSLDLTRNVGRGFSADSLERMRLFYLSKSMLEISAALMRKSGKAELKMKSASLMQKLTPEEWVKAFPLSWTHYIRLLRVQNPNARQFYETEALRVADGPFGSSTGRLIHSFTKEQLFLKIRRLCLSREVDPKRAM